MKVLSASEAVWPALLRTYDFLFRTFKWETFLKLATVATIGEGFLVSFKFWVPDTPPFEVDIDGLKSFVFKPDFMPVTICAVLALFFAGLYCYAVVIQLRFAFFHSLVHRTNEFGAAWRLYSVEANRFFGACLLLWLGFLLAIAVLAILIAISAFAVVGTQTAEGKLDPGHFLFVLFPCIGVIFALTLALCAARVVLNDFILPHMAIEGATFSKAWAEVRVQIDGNKETFVSFFILRTAMLLVAGTILGFTAWVVGLIVFGILGMSAAGFNAILDGTDDYRAYLFIAARTLFMVVGLGAGGVIAVSFGGPVCVFIRSYALFYYGGHYKALGSLLERETPESAPMEHAAGMP
jgi:hypothetical protein